MSNKQANIARQLASAKFDEILTFFHPQRGEVWEVTAGTKFWALKAGSVLVLFTESQLENLAFYLLPCEQWQIVA